MFCENLILKSDINEFPEPKENSVSTYILTRLKEHSLNSCGILNPVTGERHLYIDFDVLSRNVSKSLWNLGFKKNDTLIYSSHNGANLHVFLLGVWRAGGLIRSSYPEDTKGELLDRVKESKAEWILCDETEALECIEIIKTVPWKVCIIVFGNVLGCTSAYDLLHAIGNNNEVLEEELCENEDEEGERIALILPTSGTTGNSKGAIYTHKTIIKTLSLLEKLPLNDDPTKSMLFMGKQTHVSGCLIALAKIVAGYELLMLSKINLETIIQVVQNCKPRSIFLFPKYLTELVDYQRSNSKSCDLNSIQFVSTGGVIVQPSLVAKAKEMPNLKAFIVCYGMTECGLLTANVHWTTSVLPSRNNIGISSKAIVDFPGYSCGNLIPGTSLIVKEVEDDSTNVNNNNNNQPKFLGPGQLGELYFKSQIAFSGYFGKPSETNETLQNGWIRTGDLGYYDNNGFVFVTDRVKETFKYFNNHISPTEIEQVILRHEFVKEVCVVGINDPNGGDMIPRAFVVLKEGVSANIIGERSSLEVLQEIKEFTDCQLPSYKQLQGGLFTIPSLPYGKTGKLCRKILKNYQV